MSTEREGGRLQAHLDREDLFDLVRRERFARDQRRFAVMQECFHRDAYVRTSWYDGHGGAAYVEASRQAVSKPGRGRGKHWVFPAFAQLHGDRATVESPAMIFSRSQLEGIEVDFHVFCRFFSRAVREEGEWKLFSFEVIFEHDVLIPVDANQRVPVDQEVLSQLRPSYQFLSYLQRHNGATPRLDLLGDDRREELDAFYAREDRWLVDGS